MADWLTKPSVTDRLYREVGPDSVLEAFVSG
jgi:hypothetical protein